MEKIIDQLAVDGTVFHAPDTELKEPEKLQLFVDQLPGSYLEKIRLDNGSSQKYLRFQDHAILFKQITHLGKPWPSFKKRIQIPPRWSEAYDDISSLGLQVHFMGV